MFYGFKQPIEFRDYEISKMQSINEIMYYLDNC